MHRTEGNNNVANLFDNGPPGTGIEQEWLNAVQEEISHVIEESGISLNTAATETRTQLKLALDLLYSRAIPVGFTFPCPVSTPPTGFLALDGSSKAKATYPELYDYLKDGGAVCIYGEAGANFTLPDYRGRFLRGWSAGSGTDPDSAARTDRGDGTGGDVVGSEQADELKSHFHYAGESILTGVEGGTALRGLGGVNNWQGSNTGGNETRPVNTNVLWCIKY